ncbi:MAG TPA: Gfo/Idh/MocA family oxidoreductase [Candidatus Baltobacteraceae bacterium]|jgi:predicted dehydrogenase|nr:Gfo/Idh/MocA family oxidoreductase [Candidatus Baltobacteraceae bacterium]
MNKQKISSGDFTRRDFLKTTTTLAAAAAIAPGVFAAGDDTLKVALIGCGGRGSGAASQALSTDGPLKLVAMADAFKDRLDGSYNELKAKHGDRVDVLEENKFIGFDAYQHAIAMADVVILATPPGFRPPHFEEAVRQGKHIFMEKPVAVDAPGVRKVLAAAEDAKQKNLKVAVGLQRHHQAGYLETIQRLHDGAVGDIVATRAYWNGNSPWVRERKKLEEDAGRPLTEMEYQMRNWYYFVWLCGDHINEQHIHNLDVINWVKQGHPVRAWGMGGREVRKGIDNGEIFDHHAVEFEYADGTRCSSQCRHQPGCWDNVSEHVQGTKGLCDVSGHRIKGEQDWHFTTPGARDPYQQEHDDFFAAIRKDTPYNETAAYGAYSTMTAILGRMSTYSGKEIAWDDAINSQIDTMPKVLGWDADPPTKPDATGHYPVAVPGVTITV